MIPGAYRLAAEPIRCNEGKATITIQVVNKGDRPVQVGSHYPFDQVNPQLEFNRAASVRMRLNIPAGTAVRFEPGEAKEVELVQLGGQPR